MIDGLCSLDNEELDLLRVSEARRPEALGT